MDTVSTPTGSSMKAIHISRSPHTSIKVLPTTPSASTHFPNGVRLVRNGPHGTHLNDTSHNAFDESAPPLMSSPTSSLVFARRKRTTFKGPSLNASNSVMGGDGGTPGLPRTREGLFGESITSSSTMARPRKSQIIEEEDEVLEDEFEDEDVEDVDTFDKSPSLLATRPSLDVQGTTPLAANPTTTTSTVKSSDLEEASEPQLLPAAEIKEPQFPPFRPISPRSDTDQDLVHPPRSSSLREPKPGTPSSLAAIESFEKLESVVPEEQEPEPEPEPSGEGGSTGTKETAKLAT